MYRPKLGYVVSNDCYMPNFVLPCTMYDPSTAWLLNEHGNLKIYMHKNITQLVVSHGAEDQTKPSTQNDLIISISYLPEFMSSLNCIHIKYLGSKNANKQSVRRFQNCTVVSYTKHHSKHSYATVNISYVKDDFQSILHTVLDCLPACFDSRRQ